MLSDPYRILGVAHDADADELRAAYRAQAKRWHPDASDDPNAHARMQDLNAAYELLRDPQRRAAHDRHRNRPSDRRHHARPEQPRQRSTATPKGPPRPRAEPAHIEVVIPAGSRSVTVRVVIHNDGGPATTITVTPHVMGTVHLLETTRVNRTRLDLTFRVDREAAVDPERQRFRPPPGAWREAAFHVSLNGWWVLVTIAARDLPSDT